MEPIDQLITLQTRSDLCIPRNETVRPRSQFPMTGPPILLQQNRPIANRGNIRGVLGNKCAGQHNLKTVQIREIM